MTPWMREPSGRPHRRSAAAARAVRLGSPYISGHSRQWIKSKNPAAPAVKREAEEDWGKERRR